MSIGSARRAQLVNDQTAAETLEYETRPSRRDSRQSLQSLASKHSGHGKSAERGGPGLRDPSTSTVTQVRPASKVSSIEAAGQAPTPPEIIRMHVGRTGSNNHFLDQAYEVVRPAGFQGDPATIAHDPKNHQLKPLKLPLSQGIKMKWYARHPHLGRIVPDKWKPAEQSFNWSSNKERPEVFTTPSRKGRHFRN